MIWLTPAVIATLAGSLLLTFVYAYLYIRERERFLAIWAVSWGVYALRFVSMLAMLLWREHAVLQAAYLLLSLLSGVLLLTGTAVFIGRLPPRWWAAAAAATAAWTVIGLSTGAGRSAVTVPTFLFLAGAYVWTGATILRARSLHGPGRAWLGVIFILWGLHKADYPLLRDVAWFAPWGYLLAAGLEMSAALGMLVLYFERSRMRLQTEQREKELALMAVADAAGQEVRLLEERAHSDAMFRSVAETASDGIIVIDGEGTVLFWNRSASLILGYPAEDMVGRPLERIIPDRLLARHRAGMARQRAVPELQAARLSRCIEVAAAAADGSEIPLELSISRWSSGGGVFFTGLLRDIRDRTQLQAQLIQSQKMDAIGTFVGGIAHDFNNILTAISGYGHLLLLKLRAEDPIAADLREIVAAGDRATQLTRGLLAFSRKHETAVAPLDLMGSVLVFGPFLRRIIGEDIELVLEPGPGPVAVLGDRAQVEQVIMNLATNARDAMPQGGRLRISAGPAEIDAEFVRRYGYGDMGRYGMLTISDTGTGMTEETRRRIFDPFFTTKEVGKGTGLGLAIVYGIVKKHRGFIHVESVLGGGTEFRILLPLAPEGAVPDSGRGRPESAPLRGSGTVLLVEDNGMARQVTRRLLEEAGYGVVETVDGEEALEAYRATPDRFSLVLTDVVMPRRNGRELYDELLRFDPSVKVLFMSGYSADVVTVRELVSRGLRCLAKPFTPAELLSAVSEMLRQDRIAADSRWGEG